MKVKSIFYRDVKSTFNLPDLTGIVKAGNIPCKGNGKGLSLTDGSNGFMLCNGYDNLQYSLLLAKYNTGNIGSSATPINIASSNRLLGLNQLVNSSGIIADTSSLTVSCVGIIKY